MVFWGLGLVYRESNGFLAYGIIIETSLYIFEVLGHRIPSCFLSPSDSDVVLGKIAGDGIYLLVLFSSSSCTLNKLHPSVDSFQEC